MRFRVSAPNFRLKRTQVATGVIGVAVIGAATAAAVGTGGGSGAAPTYATVAQGDVTATAGASGNVTSADSRDLAFTTSGTVKKVYVRVGAKVRAGARLARVDQTQALEDVAAARAALAAAQAAESSGSGTTGAAAAATESSGSDTTGANAAATRSGATQVTAAATRSGATGVNAAAATAGRAATALAAYRSTASPSTTPSAKPSTTKRPSTRPSSPQNSPTSKAPATGNSSGGTNPGGTGSGGTTSAAQLEARVVQAQNSLTQAERTLAGTVIKAPIDGTVLAVNGRAGDTASASSTFITIGDLSELQLQATFSQNDVAHIRIGQEARITLSTDSTKTYDGSVTHVDSNATTSDQLVKYGVMIAFDDVPSKVLMGQSGTVSVTTGSATDVLRVPSSAVRTAANGTSTVRVRQGGRTVTRTVKVGVRGDTYVEITSGLSRGERVVTSG